MSIARHLLAGRFDAWLAPREAPPLWLFVHVPKTAGSSLAAGSGASCAPAGTQKTALPSTHASGRPAGPWVFENMGFFLLQGRGKESSGRHHVVRLHGLPRGERVVQPGPRRHAATQHLPMTGVSDC